MQTTSLIQLAYVSTQCSPFSTEDLVELLTKARAANLEQQVTGLLLHKQDSFFQVIEGSAAAIDYTFERIENDERHHRIEVLLREPVSERRYPDWQMGFVNLDNVDLSLLRGYSSFLESEHDARAFLTDIGKGEKLAAMFRSLS